MNKSLTTSDSLVGSLCREIEHIRLRHKIVSSYLLTSRDIGLRVRLSNEITQLKSRHSELLKISNNFKSQLNSSISILFLHELCHRPL